MSEHPGSHLPQYIALLSAFPSTLSALLRDLPDELIDATEGDKTWSAYEIVGHLIHAEHVDWIPRAKMILEFGETRTFEPFNREGHKEGGERPKLAQLLDEFARLREENLAQLRAMNLKEEDLARRGQHPAFGPVTLSQLLATWVTHDLTHLHQLSRVLASQNREAVGPWSAYLGVLQCAGHSAVG